MPYNICKFDKGRANPICLKELLIRLIHEIKPMVLIGATGVGGAFDKETLKAMKAVNWDNPELEERHRPIIFALSNPMSAPHRLHTGPI